MGLTSLSYLWRRDQSELLDEMIDSKVEAILVKVATLGLDCKHLGLSLGEVRDHLHKMVSLTRLKYMSMKIRPLGQRTLEPGKEGSRGFLEIYTK